jgi:predicted O-methyltransferase YrrM
MKLNEMVGYISEEEGLVLQDYASKVIEGEIVNIGTFQGKSAIYMASAKKKVYTIDPYHYELFNRYVKEFGVEVEEILQKSIDVEWDKPIGLIFADGIHLKDYVLKEFRKFEPFIVKGGMLMYHDPDQEIFGLEVKQFLADNNDEIYSKFDLDKKLGNMLCLMKK